MAGGVATVEIDPANLGLDGDPAPDNPGRIHGQAIQILNIHVGEADGLVEVTAQGKRWAVFWNIEQVPTHMHLPFQLNTKYTLSLTSFGMPNNNKRITVTVEIDPLKAGASCKCGRSHG